MIDGPFNRLPFNRAAELDVSLSIAFESGTELDSAIGLEMVISAAFESETEFSAKMAHQAASFGAMFGGPFNRIPFNRSLTIETLLSVTFESATELDSRIGLEIPLTATVETSTEMSTAMIRELAMSAVIESATEMLAALTRERYYSATLESATEFVATVTYTHVDQLTFTGAFNPGDRLVIDAKKKTITLNGQNVLHLMGGDFFDLIYGMNKITYTDKESARNVLTRVTHRDKYLY